MRHCEDDPINDNGDEGDTTVPAYIQDHADMQAARHKREVAEHAAYVAAQASLHPYSRDTYNRAGNPALPFIDAMTLNGD